MQAYVEHVNASRDAAGQWDAAVSATPDAGSVLGRFAAMVAPPGQHPRA